MWIPLVLTMLSIGACTSHHNEIQGEWVLKSTAHQQQPQGFQLSQGGLAASINQPEIQYSSWSLTRNHLVLIGKRFENNQLNTIADTMKILKLSVTDFVLQYDSTQYHYVRL